MFLSFLLSPFGKIVGYIFAGLLLVSLVFGWYEVKISEAKREALATFNQHQLEEVVKAQKLYDDDLKILQDKEREIQDSISKLNEDVNKKADKADETIRNSNDKNLDPLFNEILKNLKGRK